MKIKKIIISGIGSDRSGIVANLTDVIICNNGNIEESRMVRLGSDFIVIMLVSIKETLQSSLIQTLNNFKDLNLIIKYKFYHNKSIHDQLFR